MNNKMTQVCTNCGNDKNNNSPVCSECGCDDFDHVEVETLVLIRNGGLDVDA